MDRYNYREAVKEDVWEWLNNNWEEYFQEPIDPDDEDVFNTIYDECFTDDSVTGNASGSYTFNTWQAEENICHNLDLLEEALEEYGDNRSAFDFLDAGAEAADVTIRCYCLPQAITEVLEEHRDEIKSWVPEKEDEDDCD